MYSVIGVITAVTHGGISAAWTLVFELPHYVALNLLTDLQISVYQKRFVKAGASVDLKTPLWKRSFR
ncbi:MAG: hypothetical protein IJ839_03065 [Ruminobacter sp.]|nr:hypothetical protein [Ruminobacter sp.]